MDRHLNRQSFCVVLNLNNFPYADSTNIIYFNDMTTWNTCLTETTRNTGTKHTQNIMPDSAEAPDLWSYTNLWVAMWSALSCYSLHKLRL